MMLLRYLFFILLAMMACAVEALPLPTNLISFTSKCGQELLYQSSYKRSLWPLTQYYITQKDVRFCGVASAVMVLNALDIPRPDSRIHDNHRLFTQKNVFTERVMDIITPDKVTQRGMTLSELDAILKTFPVDVETVFSNTTNAGNFREHAKQVLSEPEQYMIVNYYRPGLNQNGVGHFSPLAAYDEHTDRFLVMDVSRYLYPAVWVKTDDLWSAINTLSEDDDLYRGYIVVKPLVDYS